jgi:zinc transporter ZupT
MTALILSVLTFFSTALGGLFALRRRKQLYLVMGFSAGVLVAAALLDLLPEALEFTHQLSTSSDQMVFLAAALGFLLYYSLDFFVHFGAAGHEHRQEEHDHTHDHHAVTRFGALAALGLTLHSFMDGFAIGAGWQADPKIGLMVAVAVLAHDFGDGVTTVGIVLGSRGGMRASLGWLLADAAAPVVGCAAGLGIHIHPGFIGSLLGFFAGSFLFIGAAHLLPEAEHEGKAPWLYIAVVAGFVFVAIIGQLLGQLH